MNHDPTIVPEWIFSIKIKLSRCSVHQLTQLAPIQALRAARNKAEADGRPDDAVCARDRQFEECGDQQPERTARECRQQSEHQFLLVSDVDGDVQDSFAHRVRNFVACEEI